ncbi:MAG: hypothetical protein A2Z25_03670 [Planctomycetes bacterium RBG_16_55_9]|nr:MAG: hypothetical protein A2Z25_03670 [Planctomycetes bacterium RBG_16_55_9]
MPAQPAFEGGRKSEAAPFHRAAGAHPYTDQRGPWITVQEGRYRYAVDQDGGVCVRLVLSEYLGCTVEWE